jgi:outer membrane protein assembly factor BamB
LLLTAPAVLAAVSLCPGQALALPRVPAGTSDPYGFSAPDAAVVGGSVLFVANKGGNSVTEVNAGNGAYISTLQGPRYHFDGPTALELVGAGLFVGSGPGGSVTELNARTGAVIRIMAGIKFGLTYPVAMASEGSRYLFVLCADGSVAKVLVATGQYLGEATGGNFGFDNPTSLVDVGNHIFVANSGSNSVTELDARDMRVVRILSGPGGAANDPFHTPIGMVAEGGNIWVTNRAGLSVTEFSAATGKVLQVVPNTEDYLPSPGAIAYGDGYLFVASPPGSSPMITQLVSTDPAKLPWMMCNTNGPYTFSNPQALVVYGTDLWVVNEGGAGGPPGNSLTEMNTETGSLVQVVR